MSIYLTPQPTPDDTTEDTQGLTKHQRRKAAQAEAELRRQKQRREGAVEELAGGSLMEVGLVREDGIVLWGRGVGESGMRARRAVGRCWPGPITLLTTPNTNPNNPPKQQ